MMVLGDILLEISRQFTGGARPLVLPGAVCEDTLSRTLTVISIPKQAFI